MSCLIITPKIRELAKKFPNETEQSVLNLVGLWQEKNNKSIEDIPLESELNDFIKELRVPKGETKTSFSTSDSNSYSSRTKDSFNVQRVTTLEDLQKVDLLFDPRTRRDRVTLIARLFSNEIDHAIAKTAAALRRRIDITNGGKREELQEELKHLNRISIIRAYTPAGIFKSVAAIFESYIRDTEEGRIEQELATINARKGSSKYSEKQKLEAAKRIATYKYNEYKKIVGDHFVFKALAEEASTMLIMTEGIMVDPNYIAPFSANLSEGDSEDNVFGEDARIFKQEEEYKDGWMNNFREVSARDSLSQEVRRMLRQVPRLDYKGKVERDDLGFIRYLDADYVHATLLDKLKDMITSEDMIPLMEDLQKLKPWVKQVTNLLNKDETLFSKFYQDLRKDFTSYWIQRKRRLGGKAYRRETISLNKPEGIYYLLDAWRDNYEGGILLDDNSVYEKNGKINHNNASKGLKLVENLNNMFQNLTTDARLQLLEKEEVWDTLMKLLHMVGIDINPATLKTALYNIKELPGMVITDPIMLLLPQLNIIFKGIIRGDIKPKIGEDGVERRGDLINTFSSAYNSIASLIATVPNDAIESSVRENDKTYYAHVTPSYLGKLIKNLKNVMHDKERFEKFMQTEYKDYEWFFKDGKWRNDWLEQLEKSEEMRKGLEHKVLLSSDKIDYTDWDSLDYTLALITEYFGDPESAKSSTKFGWYHVPILADSPSAEFIKFRRYTNGDILDDNGRGRTYDDVILDKLVDLVNQEYDRIMLVRERDVAYQSGNKRVEPLANYDIVRDEDGNLKNIGGAEFKFLTELNNITYENGETFLDKIAKIKNTKGGSELKEFIRGALSKIMEEGFEKAYKEWEEMGLLEELPSISNKFSKNNAKEALKEYYWNSTLATSQIIQITTTDLAFYKNLEDFQKRFKEIHAPSLRLNTKSTYKGERVGRDWERTIYIKDEEIASSILKGIESIILEKHKRGEFTDYDAAYILSKYGYSNYTIKDKKGKEKKYAKIGSSMVETSYINVADAQAYRSLSSYRAVLDMAGKWTDEMEQAYNNLRSGNWNMQDFRTIWQTIKPYLYTQVNSDSGIEGHTGIKTAIQHKNSEFLLLAMYDAISGPLGKSGKLRAINKFMEDNQIDVVQFESTTKVGKQGIIDLSRKEVGTIDGVEWEVDDYEKYLRDKVNNGELSQEEMNEKMKAFSLESEEDVLQKLKDVTGIGIGQENPNIVHKVSYEDYGIQTPTPEHAIDVFQLVGTQIRKLITADIPMDAVIEVDGRKMTKKEWLDLYNAINTENIIQAFTGISKIFEDPKKIEGVLQEEMRKSQRYGIDMMRACTLDENNNFNIPLYDPVVSQMVQSLLNSIIKGGYGGESGITKQKIRGGALIQVSDYGLTDDLNIVFKDKDGNELSKASYFKKHPKATMDDYTSFVEKAQKDGRLSIAYFECYMPAYSEKFYKPLMDPITHQLDVTKLPEDLRKLIGYRVPTEDKYSMAPLYIKGFLPQQNGSAIMLPAEITTISGSDFDVDKMYIMLPEFSIKNFEIRKAREDYAKINSEFGEILSKLTPSQAEQPTLKEDTSDFRKWFKDNKDKYRLATPIISKVQYDFSKSPQDNTLKARNNLLIDMMYGILTNPDIASNVLNPGGFDPQKKAARILTILKDYYQSDLAEALKEIGIVLNKTIQKDGKTYTKSISSYLLDLDLDTLDKLISVLDRIAKRSKTRLNPLSPTTQVKLHQQNMTGAKLISIYANHNASHALLQHTKISINGNGFFTLNGKKLTSLHEIINGSKEVISKNNAGFLAASVDNVKDPVLAALNQNMFTADASMLLSRLGYNSTEIGLLMMQPIIQEITRTYFRESRKGKDGNTIIEEILRKYKEKASISKEISYKDIAEEDFYIEDLADNIIMAKEIMDDELPAPDFKKAKSFYSKQVAVGILFKRIMLSSDALGKVVQATRADTQKGAAGPTIADTEEKIQKVKELIDQITDNPKFPLDNANVISLNLYDRKNDSIDTLRQKLLASPLPFLQAFYTLGVEIPRYLLEPYFPQHTYPFQTVINTLKGMTKSGRLSVKTVNNIYNDLFAYIMSRTSFFGPTRGIDSNTGISGITMTSFQKRKDFINNFPSYFSEVIANNADIASLEFIRRLMVVRANETNPVDTVIFKNVGRLSPTLRERYMRDWTSLLYMRNPEAQQLALNLFRYSYYRNGFAFGPSTFIHLASTAVRSAIPEYISTLRSLLTSKDTYTQFIDQYIFNHLDNRKLVPEIPEESTVKFIDENNKEIKDEVTFVIENNSSYEDKKVVRDKVYGPYGVVLYSFFDYIGKNINGKFVYYKLFPSETDGINVATYRRITPLGFKNSFIEYEYGVDAITMQSVINSSDVVEDSYSETSTGSESDEKEDTTYTPNSDSYYEDSQIPIRKPNYMAFEDSLKETEDAASIEPDTDYRDADGNKLCGSAKATEKTKK